MTWGYNFDGELGTGGTSNSATATQIAGLANVVGASGHVNGFTFLALKSDGNVVGWGFSGDGELLNNTTSPSTTLTPTAASGLPSASTVAVSSGDGWSLALESDGTIWSAGWNAHGQLGQGSATPPGGCACLPTTSKSLLAGVLLPGQSPVSPPGPPQSVTATAGNSSATVNWAASGVPSGSPAVTAYWVTAVTNGATSQKQTVCGTCLSASFTGLTNGQTYAFGVYATNSVGDSAVAYSNYVQPPVPGSAPIPNCAPNQLPDFGLPCTVVPDTAPVPPPPPQTPPCGPHSPPIPAKYTLDIAVRFLPPSSQSQLGGIYANISDSVPYVDPASNPLTSAWVMMQVPNQQAEYAQAGWFQYPAGDQAGRTKTAFTETDGSPDSTVIGTDKVHWETDYNIPAESAYYSVQLRKGIQDNIIAPIDPGNGLNRYFFYRNGNLLGSPMVLEASLVLSWADVAGEIHGAFVGGLHQPSTSRMPGTFAVPQTFSDIHIYYTPESGSPGWQRWETPDRVANQDSADWGASIGSDSFQIWDKTC
jgi:hypothetical protein